MEAAARALGYITVMLAPVVIAAILFLDPPPLRLRDAEEVVLRAAPSQVIGTVRPGPIENGIGCKERLSAHASDINFRSPIVTFSDWLDRQAQKPPDLDFRLLGKKSNRDWSVSTRVDGGVKKVCWLRSADVAAGVTEAFCGPSVVHEDSNTIRAIQSEGEITAVVFDKRTYSAVITSLGSGIKMPSASILYLDCYYPR